MAGKRRCETKSISMDAITEENLDYILGSHYCNSLGASAFICAIINERAAELKLINRMEKAAEVVVPQGWYGGSSGIVAIAGV
ncbi:hypothetical protein Metho_1191 [Methanomethylovorans hollandica DSM 15978]|uniref:Uncharacterized protein n=1 Tax=Methanomethylovorans hollandica (strain DSM 15978 / NBRC 107637 / DMS1) TaxID=867904 RepID=L0KWB3_METHD|nr:hypothetical protein [Methanomethylovorans hollandica]AGB49421.1 hypothetical protein Metho_1191 [Methanomethylovorans hollandica DSM 15978]